VEKEKSPHIYGTLRCNTYRTCDGLTYGNNIKTNEIEEYNYKYSNIDEFKYSSYLIDSLLAKAKNNKIESINLKEISIINSHNSLYIVREWEERLKLLYPDKWKSYDVEQYDYYLVTQIVKAKQGEILFTKDLSLNLSIPLNKKIDLSMKNSKNFSFKAKKGYPVFIFLKPIINKS
jgi:hypothetical protein